MNELIEWLRAQLDEDERVAQALHGSRWYVYEDGQVVEWDGETWADGSARLPNRHQGSWLALDPTRVRAEVAAKRRIIDRLDRLHEMHQGAHECPGTDDNCGWWPVGDCPTLWEVLAEVRDLASVYAGRPGYREEWGCSP